jgi:hypothetical protein
MEHVAIDLDSADPVAVAGLLTLLLEHAPAPATTQAIEMVRPRFDDRDWSRVMAAIAPVPV